MIPAIRIDPSGAYTGAAPIAETLLVPEVKLDLLGNSVHGEQSAGVGWKAIYLQEGIDKTKAYTIVGNVNGAYTVVVGYPSTTAADLECSIAYAEGIVFFCNGVNSVDDSFTITYVPIGTVVDTHPILDNLRVGATSCEAIGEYSEASGENSKAYGKDSLARGYSAIASGDFSVAENQSKTGYIPVACSITAGGTVTIPLYDATAEFAVGDDVLVFGVDGKPLSYIGTVAAPGPVFGVDTTFDLTAGLPYGAVTTGYIVSKTKGSYAYAGGKGSSAIGIGAHAEGSSTSATGLAAHSEGSNTIASGDYAHAEGNGAHAHGTNSHAEGVGQAYGLGSHAENSGNAFGQYSHSSGTSVSYGQNAYSEGGSTEAGGQHSHAEGDESRTCYPAVACTVVGGIHVTITPIPALDISYQFVNGDTVLLYNITGGTSLAPFEDTIATAPTWNAGPKTVTFDITTGIGTNTDAYIVDITFGRAAHSEGHETTSVGEASHSEGYQTVASGYYSHAEGWGCQATNISDHAEGTTTSASGSGSHAEGLDSRASGGNSHAEGETTHASGYCAHAEGYQTTAATSQSHAEGYQSVTRYASSHASASGIFSNLGDAQYERIVCYATTANAVATPLLIAGTDAITIPDGAVFRFTAEVVGVKSTSKEVVSYKVAGLVQRKSGAGATLPWAGLVVTEFEDAALAACDFSIGVSGNDLQLLATGLAGSSIRWVASVHLTETFEVGYA